jgi:hypothetical protein
MHRINRVGMALVVAMIGLVTILATSFLPFFMSEAWGSLWGARWWSAAPQQSFCRAGPFTGVSQWPALLAVPLSGVLLAAAFSVLAAVLVVSWRAGALRARRGG